MNEFDESFMKEHFPSYTNKTKRKMVSDGTRVCRVGIETFPRVSEYGEYSGETSASSEYIAEEIALEKFVLKTDEHGMHAYWIGYGEITDTLVWYYEGQVFAP